MHVKLLSPLEINDLQYLGGTWNLQSNLQERHFFYKEALEPTFIIESFRFRVFIGVSTPPFQIT